MISRKIAVPAVIIPLVLFIIFSLFTVFKYKIELDKKVAELEQLQSKYEDTAEYVKKLENKLAAEVDEDYVVDVAKDKLNFALPEEVKIYNDIAG